MKIVHVLDMWERLKGRPQDFHVCLVRSVLHEHRDTVAERNPRCVEHKEPEDVGADRVAVPQSAIREVDEQRGN